MAAAKDNVSLEKQSYWEVPLPPIPPTLEGVIPGSCYHKESEAKLTAAVTQIPEGGLGPSKSAFMKICAKVQELVCSGMYFRVVARAILLLTGLVML